MISIRRSEVPLYLQTSSFYLSLSEEDDEPISIATTNFKPDPTILSALDLRHLLGTIRFWGLDSVPSELIEYCMNADTIDVLPILGEFDWELDYLKLFPELLKLPRSKRIERCALFGNLSILQYITEKEGRDYSVAISAAAATGGSLPCLKYLISTHCPVDVTAAVAASRHNQLDCLAYLFGVGGIATHYSVTQTAAASGHLRILQYFHQHGGPWGLIDFTQAAAKGGHLQCMVYLTENGCPWGHAVFSFIAENGHLDCLQYAREHGCPWIESDASQFRSVTTNAAKNGHIDCLMYTHQAGCPIGSSACVVAAQGGHLSCLVYAHEHGGAWDETTTLAAASNGHLDCLAYAIEQDCVVVDKITEHAAAAPNLDCLKYLIESGYSPTAETCASAAQNSVAHLTYLHTLGWPWDAGTRIKAVSCTARDASCLQYAHEHGCPWDARTCAAAALVGNLKALKYAHEHGCPWDVTTVQNAVRSDEATCLEYAHKNKCPLPDSLNDDADFHVAFQCMYYIFENIPSNDVLS